MIVVLSSRSGDIPIIAFFVITLTHSLIIFTIHFSYKRYDCQVNDDIHNEYIKLYNKLRKFKVFHKILQVLRFC